MCVYFWLPIVTEKNSYYDETTGCYNYKNNWTIKIIKLFNCFIFFHHKTV